MRRTVIGLALVGGLTAVAVYSAAHGSVLGVILAAPPAALFLLALVDNRFVYTRRSTPAEPTAGQPSGHPDPLGRP